MPHAVTHFIIAVVLVDIFRDRFVKNKKSFPLHYILIAGIASLIPDLDVLIYWILYYFGYTFNEIHRTFSHTLFVPLAFLILGFAAKKLKSRELGKHHLKLSTIFFVMSFAVFTHLLLDFLIAGTIMPLYPLTNFQTGLNLINFLPAHFQNTILPALDALILILWFIHIEVKHKISSFI